MQVYITYNSYDGENWVYTDKRKIPSQIEGCSVELVTTGTLILHDSIYLENYTLHPIGYIKGDNDQYYFTWGKDEWKRYVPNHEYVCTKVSGKMTDALKTVLDNNEIEELNKKLIDATLDKDTKKVKELIKQGADMYYSFEDLQDEYDGGHAKAIACSQYFYDDESDSTMFDLFEELENLKKLDSNDMNTVLLTAATVGHLDKAIEAIENGADIEGDDVNNESTPLVEAVEMGNTQIAEYLINKGANVNAWFMNSEPVLMRAIITKNTQIAKLLIDKGADIYATSGLGRNIIGIAAQIGNKEIIEILLKKGVDPFEEDERGMKPIDYARKFEHEEIQNFLIVWKILDDFKN